MTETGIRRRPRGAACFIDAAAESGRRDARRIISNARDGGLRHVTAPAA